MPRLRLKIKDQMEDVVIDKEHFLIGRDGQCDLMIPSGFISRQHAEIVQSEDGFLLKDLASKMGTFLNGEKVSEAPLKFGDTIKFSNRMEAVFMGNVAMESTETLVAQKPVLQKEAERLIALNGPLSGQEFPLDRNITLLGRGMESHIRIMVDTVSTKHAEITRENEGYVITDLDSGNGTYVGEQRIKRVRLKPGDKILIDWVAFRFEEPHYRMGSEGTVIQSAEPKPEGHDELAKPREDVTDKTLSKDAPLNHARTTGGGLLLPFLVFALIIGLGYAFWRFW